MDLTRRGWIGGLLGMLGLGTAAKAAESAKLSQSDRAYDRLLQAMKSMRPGGWSEDHWAQSTPRLACPHEARERANRAWDELGFGDRAPNPHQSKEDFLDEVVCQLRYTWTALIWKVPNVWGDVFELYVIPTALAVPQPAIQPDYPDGYYRVQPIQPGGPFSSYPTPVTAVGAAIPAQWVHKVKVKHPLTTTPMEKDANLWSDTTNGTVQRATQREGQAENHGRLFVAAPGSQIGPFDVMRGGA